MRQTNFITSIKKKNTEKITFIILGACIEYKQKNNPPKALSKYNGNYLIHHQVQQIKSNYNNTEIIYISGHESQKIFKIKNDFRIVENVTYFDNGEFEQLRLGIQNMESNKLCIVPDNCLVFNFALENESKVFTSDLAINNPGYISNKYIENISFGLTHKITKSFFLVKNELEILKKILIDGKNKNYNLFAFEIINMIIDKGGKFKKEDTEYILYENSN